MKSKRKPEINCQKQKNTNTQRLNSQYITEEVRDEIRKHLETSENAAKAVLRRKFVAIQSYLKKQTKKNSKKQTQPDIIHNATREIQIYVNQCK